MDAIRTDEGPREVVSAPRRLIGLLVARGGEPESHVDGVVPVLLPVIVAARRVRRVLLRTVVFLHEALPPLFVACHLRLAALLGTEPVQIVPDDEPAGPQLKNQPRWAADHGT